jgi:hypothetical protein
MTSDNDAGDTPLTPSQTPETSAPIKVRSFDEMNTGQMVFELQGTIGEIKAAVLALTHTVDHGFNRIEGIERTTSEIKEALRGLTPKIDDLVGFTRHRAPDLASKADLVTLRSDLQTDINLRPTRRQAILDIAWVVGLITLAVTLGSKFAH